MEFITAVRTKKGVRFVVLLYMSLADKRIKVEYLYERTLKAVKNYSIETNNNVVADITIEYTHADILKAIDEAKSKRKKISSCSMPIIPYYNEELFEPVYLHRLIADAMLTYSTVLVHGTVIATDNRAYMFTAPSGTGKTTRMLLWKREYPDSIIVNGDKPLIKITDTEAIACGTPWCGKEGLNTNTMVPLRAIFLLERADEGEGNSIKELSMGEAFPTLLQQTYRPQNPELVKRTMQLLKSLEGKVKIYRFRSAPTREAIRLAYETARPQ